MGSTVVDSVGRFTLDQLAEGTYQVILFAMPGRGSVNIGISPTSLYAYQTVTVADGVETPVVLTLDLASPQVSTPPAGFPRGGNPQDGGPPPGGDNPPRR